MCANRSNWFIAGAFCIVIGAGCTRSQGPERVSGTVTLHGSPLDQGNIQFRPADSAAASYSGGMIVDGKYDVPAASGVMPGRYRVVISSPDPKETVPYHGGGRVQRSAVPEMGGGNRSAKERIPPEYNIRSKEIVEIKRGVSNVFDFNIE